MIPKASILLCNKLTRGHSILLFLFSFIFYLSLHNVCMVIYFLTFCVWVLLNGVLLFCNVLIWYYTIACPQAIVILYLCNYPTTVRIYYYVSLSFLLKFCSPTLSFVKHFSTLFLVWLMVVLEWKLIVIFHPAWSLCLSERFGLCSTNSESRLLQPRRRRCHVDVVT
jgi:hypothetical protein